MLDSILAAVLGMDELDERFISHRHRSSRFALAVGVIALALWSFYDLWAHDTLRTDLFLILMAIALAKVSAMVYFRIVE